MTMLHRTARTLTLTIAESAALSGEFEMNGEAGGMVYMPATWTAASIGFQVAHVSGGTYYPLYDHDGTIVEIAGPTVDNAYEIPPEVYGARFVKLWSQDGAASGTNQDAARTLVITLKS